MATKKTAPQKKAPNKTPGTSEKQWKDKAIPGDRALAVLLDDKPVRHEISPWPAADAIEIGVQRDGAFSPLDNMTILAIAGDYRRRLSRLERREFCDAVYAIRLIMYHRLKNDFPDCHITMQIIQPRGDIGVVVDNCPFPYINDRQALQDRLDDACRRVADCLGV